MQYNDPKGQAIVLEFNMPSSLDICRIELLQRLKIYSILRFNLFIFFSGILIVIVSELIIKLRNVTVFSGTIIDFPRLMTKPRFSKNVHSIVNIFQTHVKSFSLYVTIINIHHRLMAS